MSAELKAIFWEAAERKGWLNEAREQEKLEVAKRLLRMGLSLDQVAEGSGYPIEKVRKLKEEL